MIDPIETTDENGIRTLSGGIDLGFDVAEIKVQVNKDGTAIGAEVSLHGRHLHVSPLREYSDVIGEFLSESGEHLYDRAHRVLRHAIDQTLTSTILGHAEKTFNEQYSRLRN